MAPATTTRMISLETMERSNNLDLCPTRWDHSATTIRPLAITVQQRLPMELACTPSNQTTLPLEGSNVACLPANQTNKQLH